MNDVPSPAVGRGRMALHAMHLVVALFGGLSLLLPLIAPFNIMMSGGMSIADGLGAMAVCGGLPLGCAASVILSKWLFLRGRPALALVVAIAATLMLAALVAWAVMIG